jgi:hypothetical protein
MVVTEEMLNRTIAARKLGISTKTLRRLELENDGPRLYRVGKSVKYRPSDLERYLDRVAVVPLAEQNVR